MSEPTKYPPEIADAICAIMTNVDYVQKKGMNEFHRYKFAAVGDILAKVQPAMAKAGLVVVPSETARHFENGVMAVEYEFTLVHKSGAVWPDRPRFTGMATAVNSKGGFDDKCVNKCATAAGKHFLLGLFKIPTGDMPDADEDEDKPGTKAPVKSNGAKTAAPDATADDPLRVAYKSIMDGIKKAANPEGLQALMKARAADLETIKAKSEEGYTTIIKRSADRAAALSQAPIADQEAA